MNNFISDDALNIIGYQDIIEELTLYSPYGINVLHTLKPFDNVLALEEELALLDLFIERINDLENIKTILSKFKNIKGILRNCKQGYVLEIEDLYEIKLQAIYMDELRDFLEKYKVNMFLNDCQKIIALLSENEDITYDYFIYDRYSDKLKEIRSEKRKIEHKYHFNSHNEDNALMELRNKYVILELEEEFKIRQKLSQELQLFIDDLNVNISIIGRIDLLMGKAKLAVKYNAVKPQFGDGLCLKQMFHPIIRSNVLNQGNSYTENSIELHSGTTVVTGANMSGKSSVLKTIALNVLLAHLGFFLFCEEAVIPLLDGIEFINHNTTDDKHGLSHFGYEIIAINHTIGKMRQGQFLVCIDEFARSTNHTEGQKFVSALAELANSYRSFTILTTHYDGVIKDGMSHYQIEGLKEIDFNEINNINNYMDYRLKKVTITHSVPKEAYKVAVLLNLDKEFKNLLDKFYKE